MYSSMSNNSSFPALSPMPAASYGQYDVNYPAKTFAGNPVHATENDLRIVAMQVERLTKDMGGMQRPQPGTRVQKFYHNTPESCIPVDNSHNPMLGQQTYDSMQQCLMNKN
jgi:hypothetical protein